MSRQTLCFTLDERTLEQSQELIIATGISYQDWLEQLVKSDLAAFYGEQEGQDDSPF